MVRMLVHVHSRRMDLALHRCILGRHSEGIPAHRVKDFVPLHPAEAGDHVAHRVIADVPHVDAPRGVGEHLQYIGLWLVAVAVSGKAAGLGPSLLPSAVGRARVETPTHSDDSDDQPGRQRGEGRGRGSG